MGMHPFDDMAPSYDLETAAEEVRELPMTPSTSSSSSPRLSPRLPDSPSAVCGGLLTERPHAEASGVALNSTQEEFRALRWQLIEAGVVGRESDAPTPVCLDAVLPLTSTSNMTLPAVCHALLDAPPSVTAEAKVEVERSAEPPAMNAAFSNQHTTLNSPSVSNVLDHVASPHALASAMAAVMAEASSPQPGDISPKTSRSPMPASLPAVAALVEKAPEVAMSLPRVQELAERIAQLPAAWQGALLRLIEEAEEAPKHMAWRGVVQGRLKPGPDQLS